jgi:hypothetical protein
MRTLLEWAIWLIFAERPGEWDRKEWVCRIRYRGGLKKVIVL